MTSLSTTATSPAKSGGSRRRDGCTECRRKKVKCDMGKPVCSRCVRHPKGCIYALNIVNQAPSSVSCPKLPSREKDGQSGRSHALQHRPSHWGSLITAQPQPSFSPFLSSDESRFFMHVFQTETAPRLFPAAPPIFLQRMISASLETPCLLHALLASACSHHSRLIQDRSPQSRVACLQFTNLAISGLRSALMGPALTAEIVTAAMALCTNDVCNGNMHIWRTHLRGVMRLLAVLLDQSRSSEADEAYLRCLVKWFTTMDVLAGLSGIHTSSFSGDLNQSLSAVASPDSRIVDDVCGYSLELVPILTRISQLIHGRDLSSTAEHVVPLEVLDEAETLERSLYDLVHRTVSDANRLHRGDLATELECTHLAFVHSGLLHLHRRVQMLPVSDPTVQADIQNILDAMTCIRPLSPANILILWPIFSAGCESTDPLQRELIQNRMTNMQNLGLGNFTRARQYLNDFWASATPLPWDVYFAQLGVELVLF